MQVVLPPAAVADGGVEAASRLNAEVEEQHGLVESPSSSGVHVWVPDSDAMEGIGAVLQQQGVVRAGMAVLLKGQLGAGKTTIARGFVRAFCRDAFLDVPSPTYLLCLSYAQDLAHDRPAREAQEQLPRVHHMDPYRLGRNVDKMAGLIDFEEAFSRDICLVEWPDRMPPAVQELPKRGVEVRVSGTGVQGAGRLVHVLPLSPTDPTAPILDQWRRSSFPKPQSIAVNQAETPSLSDGLAPGEQEKQEPGAVPGWGGSSFENTPQEQWLVLGIESSCDDTAAAVVRGDGHVLAHRIASQVGLHEQYGGVKPDVARQAHADAIHSVVDGCLQEAGVLPEQLTAVAATVGPGLSLCLQVGVRHGLGLAAAHRLPFVPVHHMEAHSLITRMPGIIPVPLTFPALLLLVSGGHNMLVLCRGVGHYLVVGTTLDDSVGECFDKTARLLGISAIPGGPKLEELAGRGDPARYKQRLPLPMQQGLHKNTCNFSFSGIKTSVARLVEEETARLRQEHGQAAVEQPSSGGRHQNGAELAEGGTAGSELSSARQDAKRSRVLESGLDKGREKEGDRSQLATGVDEAQEQQTNGAVGNREGQSGTGGAEGGEERGCNGAGPAPCSAFDSVLDAARADIAAAFQAVCVRFLKQRTARALEWLARDATEQHCPPVTCLVVAGGVAANRAVRAGMEEVAAKAGVPCVCPPIKYCTDNGLMVAWAGIERLALGLCHRPPRPSAVDGHVEVLPRWPLGPLDPRGSVKGGGPCKMYH